MPASESGPASVIQRVVPSDHSPVGHPLWASSSSRSCSAVHSKSTLAGRPGRRARPRAGWLGDPDRHLDARGRTRGVGRGDRGSVGALLGAIEHHARSQPELARVLVDVERAGRALGEPVRHLVAVLIAVLIDRGDRRADFGAGGRAAVDESDGRCGVERGRVVHDDCGRGRRSVGRGLLVDVDHGDGHAALPGQVASILGEDSDLVAVVPVRIGRALEVGRLPEVQLTVRDGEVLVVAPRKRPRRGAIFRVVVGVGPHQCARALLDADADRAGRHRAARSGP